MKRNKMIPQLLGIIIVLLSFSCHQDAKKQLDGIRDKIILRDFPSIFQAWNPIEMEEFPLETNEQRLEAAAMHDLLWEEPVSQLGYGVELVLGARWDSIYGGCANTFTLESKEQAIQNREAMLELNPNMIFLMEIRWKDAPGSYLPENSDWWKRDTYGNRIRGWDGGPEPYYYLDYRNLDFQKQIVNKAEVVCSSGIYDGIMLDWWGSHGEMDTTCIGMLAAIRNAIGDDGIIVVNNDRIAPLPKSAPFINGAFMEETEKFHDQPGDWPNIMNHLWWFESNVREPKVNCLEIQAGSPKDLLRGLSISLIFSSGYFLYTHRDNSDPAPDHLHRWEAVYDKNLGAIKSDKVRHDEGYYYREYENGCVFYNPVINDDCILDLRKYNKKEGTSVLNKGEGLILLYDD